MSPLAWAAFAAGSVLVGSALFTAGWIISAVRGERLMEDMRTAMADQQLASTAAATAYLAGMAELHARVAAAGNRAVAAVVADQATRPAGPRHAARPAALTSITDAFHAITAAETWVTSDVA